jgi:chitodextrinase
VGRVEGLGGLVVLRSASPAGCIRVNPPQTSITITNLMPDTTFTYVVYAINSRGQRSGNSNSVTYTTPPDVTPPAPAPQLSQTYLRPTRIGVSWTGSTDNTSQVWHTLYLNGDPLPQFTDWIGLRSATLFNLTPGTTYEFQVVARDRYFNLAPSNVVSVTTPSTTDTTPPTAPTNLVGAELDNEIHMSWTQSTDDADPQSEILYEFYLNGVAHPDDILFGSSGLVYCRFASVFTTIVAKAVDTSGNRSGPSNESPSNALSARALGGTRARRERALVVGQPFSYVRSSERPEPPETRSSSTGPTPRA